MLRHLLPIINSYPRDAAAAYTPASEFTGTQKGGFWHFLRTNATVNSDGSGGTPTAGNTAGRYIDLSGNSNHLVQSSASKRFVAQDNYAKPDGFDDFMDVVFASSIATATVLIAYTKSGVALEEVLFTNNNSDAYRIFFNSSEDLALYRTSFGTTYDISPDTGDMVSGGTFPAGTSPDTVLRHNGSAVASGSQGAANLTGIRIASRQNNSKFSDARFQAVFVIDSIDLSMVTRVENWMINTMPR